MSSRTSGNDFSRGHAVSANGRFVIFGSSANDLVPDDTNGVADVFVYDRTTRHIERISVDSAGNQSNDFSYSGSLSADGRYAVFSSAATNLVAGDTNDFIDVFLYDRQTHTTTRISLDSNGNQALPPSSPYSGGSLNAVISSEGRYVAFDSDAENLVQGDTNGFRDVFLRDRQTGATTLISRSPTGQPGDQQSDGPRLSSSGRYVVFNSGASNLDPNSSVGGVFLRDLQTSTTTLVSVTPGGGVPNGASFNGAVSDDGRYVVFSSENTNLVPGDTNGFPDVFLRDMQAGTTTRVNVGPGGVQANGMSFASDISSNGRYVVFTSFAGNFTTGDNNGERDVYVYDRQAGGFSRASVGANGQEGITEHPLDGDPFVRGSYGGSISGDGGVVVFEGYHSNLIAGDTNDLTDVFVRDRVTPSTVLVSASLRTSLSGEGSSYPGTFVTSDRLVSGDGRYVVFSSNAPNLVSPESSGTFIRDRQSGVTTLLKVQGKAITAREPTISGDGRYIAFVSSNDNLVPGDTNGWEDVFVYDRVTGTFERVNVGSNSAQTTQPGAGTPSISASGRYVAFVSGALGTSAGTPIDARIFVRDRATHKTYAIAVSPTGQPPNSQAVAPAISANGRYVAFEANATNLVPGDTNDTTDVFVRDLYTNTTRLVSANPSGFPGNSASVDPSISDDGRFIAFASVASDLVPGDGPDSLDVFVRDALAGETSLVSLSSGGEVANGSSALAAISGNGRFVSFVSDATNIVAGDTNNRADVFVRDRYAQTTTRDSISTNGGQASDSSSQPSLNAEGRVVVFASTAPDLVANDLNAASDMFAHERRQGTAIRVNAGGPGFTDSAGRFWEADRGFNTGAVSSFLSPIANTLDDPLYQNERWDASTAPELQYRFAVPNGEYLVRLHFAENDAKNFAVGKRVFDVDIEGTPAFTNLDIFREAGSRTALVKSSVAMVQDGQLTILFRHRVQNPLIDAIEIVERLSN